MLDNMLDNMEQSTSIYLLPPPRLPPRLPLPSALRINQGVKLAGSFNISKTVSAR